MNERPTQGIQLPDDAGPGDPARVMLEARLAEGMERGVLLLRHSAREYRRDIHDLENPLTEAGRSLALTLGRRLPQSALRGYASPAHRCIETASLLIEGANTQHQRQLGEPTARPVEALGVFFALDQIRMWKGLRQAEGLSGYVDQWVYGGVDSAIMMAPTLAARFILDVLLAKLDSPGPQQQSPSIDICVTHDMTILMMRHVLGLEPVERGPVNYLDGLLLYREGERVMLASSLGGRVVLDPS